MSRFLTMSVLLWIFLAAGIQSQTKRALVIGIGLQEDKAWSKINGDKDVLYVEEMLENAGFGVIITLVNEQATKRGIIEAFKHLETSCQVGDVVYVHFSGHGQQMKDLHNDETDGLDECWIPYDAYRKPCKKDFGEKHLSDDEVNVWLNAIRDKVGDSGKILVIVDACHSGGATRGDEEEVVRGVADVFEAISAYFERTVDDRRGRVVNPDARPLAERWITVSACKSSQQNLEMKNPAVGKLTYALYQMIQKWPDGDNQEFFRHIRKFVNSNTGSRPQTPLMTGETDRFRITDILRQW